MSRFCVLYASGLLAAVLLLPGSGLSKEHEASDLMNRLEVAYTEVVKVLMISSVQEFDDLPYGQARGWAKEIREVAIRLRKIKEFKDNESVAAFSRELEKHSGKIEALATKKRWKGLIAALLRMQATCIRCHKKNRF